MKTSLLKIYSLFVFGALLAYAQSASAYSAVATIKGYANDSVYYSANYPTQKEADKAAIAGCRGEAGKHGIAKLANQCKIALRGKGPGYGAIACGTDGCGFTTAYDSTQEAVDAAYASCDKSYKNCQSENITNWEDFAGFPQSRETKKTADAGDCRPRTRELRCTFACNNGDCLVKYENSCQIRVQVRPEYDSFKNQYVYPAPSC
jgi:hypothetical protein